MEIWSNASGSRHFLGLRRHIANDLPAVDAKKIMVSQSTSGDIPDSGLDVLNQDGDSVEVALARQLVRSESDVSSPPNGDLQGPSGPSCLPRRSVEH